MSHQPHFSEAIHENLLHLVRLLALEVSSRARPGVHRPAPCRPGSRSPSVLAYVAHGLDIDGDVTPAPLLEPEDAQHGAREVTEHDRQPDLACLEPAHPLEQRAQADGNADLRNDRDRQLCA